MIGYRAVAIQFIGASEEERTYQVDFRNADGVLKEFVFVVEYGPIRLVKWGREWDAFAALTHHGFPALYEMILRFDRVSQIGLEQM